MKCLVSRVYLFTYATAIILFILPVTAVFSYALVSLDFGDDLIAKAFVGIFIALFLIGLFLYCYMFFFDFPSARIYFDKSGICLRIGFQKKFYSWDTVQECTMVKTRIHGYGVSLYWVCFSRFPLTMKEKQDFLRKTRHKLDQVVFFQYREKTFSHLMQFVPNDYVSRLLEQQADIVAHMNPVEKFYHK